MVRQVVFWIILAATHGFGKSPLAFAGPTTYDLRKMYRMILAQPGFDKPPTTPGCESPMKRLKPIAAALLVAFFSPQLAQVLAQPVQIQTGFAVLANEAGVTIPLGDTKAETDRDVYVIDPSGRAWSVQVANHLIELQPGAIAAESAKTWKARKIGSLKLTPGREYKIVGQPDPAEAAKTPADSKKKSPKPLAPNWVLIADPATANHITEVEKLLSGFQTVSPDKRRSAIRTNYEGADFKPPATVKQWEARRAELREQVLVTNGLWPMWPKTPLHPKVFGKLDRGDYTIEKVALETVPGFHLSGNIYRPKNATGKLPAVLSPHGHWADGRMNEAVQARCIRLAKLGFIALSYDMVGYNDSKQFKHEFSNENLNRWGLNLVGFHTFNSIRALDWLESLPDVDSARLGCTGESGGGTQTFLLNAVEDRIAAAAPIVMISEYFQGGCVCENAAGMRLKTDNLEIGAMFAPKPMRLVGATGDWTKNIMTIVQPTLAKVYGLYGRSDLVVASRFNFEHNYNRVSRNEVYPFFAKWLQNVPDSDALREPELTIETAETLSTVAEDKKIASEMKSPEELERDLIAAQKRQVGKLLAPATAVEWQANRKMLATAHRVRTGVQEPTAAELKSTVVQTDLYQPGVQMQRFHVSRSGSGDAIPVLEFRPDRYNGVTVVLTSPKGIAAVAENKVELTQALLKSGASVITYDPLFVGAAFDSATASIARPDTAHFNCYNPTVSQDQAQDLATVVAFAKSRPTTRLVHLAGVQGGGSLALWVRPVLTNLGRTFVAIDGWDDQKEGGSFPARLAFAGWGQAGGLQGAASLCSPSPIWISSPSRSFDRQKLESVFRFEGAESQLKQDQENKKPTTAAIAKWLLTGE